MPMRIFRMMAMSCYLPSCIIQIGVLYECWCSGVESNVDDQIWCEHSLLGQ